MWGVSTQEKAPTSAKPLNSLDTFFHITERGSTIGREIRGGVVTFFAMAYILVVNPSILSAALPQDGSITPAGIAAGTALVAGIMTILMGVVANYPLALAAGLGLNAIVAFTLVLGSGLSFQEAMGLIFWEGILITLLVLTGFRDAVFRAVPYQIKTAISVGIGLFITLVGLINAGIIRAGATPVQLGINGSLQGWPTLVFVVGLGLTIILYVRKVKGAMLIGLITSTVLAAILQLFVHLPVRSEGSPTGWGQTIPALSGSPISIPSFNSLFQINFFGAFGKLGVVSVVLLIFSLMLADFFDTMGSAMAIAKQGDFLTEDGNVKDIKQILIVDSAAAAAGGFFGASSITTFIESASGAADGGRTGLSSIFTGLLFIAAAFIAPLISIVSSAATCGALVLVGFLMMSEVTEIDWNDLLEGFPAFMVIAGIPMTYSISDGIGFGFIFYVVVALVTGNVKKVKPLMWVATVAFVAYFIIAN
ncbi:MAG: NCS2 family permease [Actinomyces sp. oral taxon 181]|nr:NCS2 family permease [Actinomyces sp. oral taxon 181]